jgi:hypothetical protein
VVYHLSFLNYVFLINNYIVRNNAIAIYFSICYPCDFKFNNFKLYGNNFCCQKPNAFYFTLMSHFHKYYYIPKYNTTLFKNTNPPISKFHYSYKIDFNLLDDIMNEALHNFRFQ